MSARILNRFEVLMISTSFPSAANRASGIFVERLVSQLAAKLPMSVVTPAGASSANTVGCAKSAVRMCEFRYAPRRWQLLAQRPGGIPVALRAQPWLYAFIPFFLLSMAFAVARRTGPDTVIHANWAICAMVAGVVARLRGCAMLVTVRGEDVTRAQTSRLHRFVLSRAVALSARVATVSEAFRDLLAAQYPDAASKIVCVPNGVDEQFVDVGRTRINTPSRADARRVKLITVGSLIARKGIDQILEAIARVPAELDCVLEVVGDGPLAATLAIQVEHLGIGPRVRFLGAVEPQRVAALMAASHIFVLSSHSEGRPNAVLEAMAAALPVVATDIDGVRELVVDGETGVLFTDGAVERLADVLTALIGDRERREQLGAQGARRIDALGLHWSQTAAQYRALYEEIACARR